MLNEFKEFNEYIDVNNTRLSPAHIMPADNSTSVGFHFGALERPLTIIARRYIFHDVDDIEKLNTLNDEKTFELMSLAKEKLAEWCNVTFPAILEKLVEEKCAKLNDPNKIKIEKEFYLKQWNYYLLQRLKLEQPGQDLIVKEKDIFVYIKGKEERGYSMWFFSKIIAQALEEGPLYNNIIYVKNDFLDNLVCLKKGTFDNLLTTKLRKNRTALATAYYYLKTKQTNCKFLNIPYADIAQWLSIGNRNDKELIYNSLYIADTKTKMKIFNKSEKQLLNHSILFGLTDEFVKFIDDNNIILVNPEEKPNSKEYILLNENVKTKE